MTLIIEDGTLVPGANSYRSVDDIRNYAIARGVTLSSIDSDIEIMSTKAIVYLEAKRKEYQGTKVSQTQSLQWPRIDVEIDSFDVDTTTVPTEIGDAQCQLIIEQSLGTDIMPTQNNPAIKSEKIGPIQTDYAINPGNYFQPFLATVDAILEPLLRNNSGALSIQFLRV